MERDLSRIVFTYKSDEYYIEIEEDYLWKPLEYGAWLYHKDCGIKMFMFGMSVDDVTMDEFIDLVEVNLDKQIEIYEEQFCY